VPLDCAGPLLGLAVLLRIVGALVVAATAWALADWLVEREKQKRRGRNR